MAKAKPDLRKLAEIAGRALAVQRVRSSEMSPLEYIGYMIAQDEVDKASRQIMKGGKKGDAAMDFLVTAEDAAADEIPLVIHQLLKKGKKPNFPALMTIAASEDEIGRHDAEQVLQAIKDLAASRAGGPDSQAQLLLESAEAKALDAALREANVQQERETALRRMTRFENALPDLLAAIGNHTVAHGRGGTLDMLHQGVENLHAAKRERIDRVQEVIDRTEQAVVALRAEALLEASALNRQEKIQIGQLETQIDELQNRPPRFQARIEARRKAEQRKDGIA